MFRVNTPSGGKSLLYVRYRDMRSRAHGRATRTPWTYPPGWPWKSFAEFRAWALSAGFSKLNNSPDRKDARLPYSETNVLWTTHAKNCGSSRGRAYYAQSDDAVRGQEPPMLDEVPF